MNRRQFVRASVGGVGMAAGLRGRGWGDEAPAADQTAGARGTVGEVLYNGIRLPTPWPPPQLAPLPTRRGELPLDPPAPPSYLKAPPAVIPIDVGRQLFVDDFLVAETTLTRTFHQARFHPTCPVLRPDRPWEGTVAMPFSDGVWFDPEDRLFKMWYYSGGSPPGVCHATSADGLHWDKPALDVKAGTNLTYSGRRDSITVWLDRDDPEPKRRYKMFRAAKGGSTAAGKWGVVHSSSPDGIHWEESAYRTGPSSDRTTAFYNPFRKVWVYSIRCDPGWQTIERHRYYWECREWAAGPTWDLKDPGRRPPMWAYADALDVPDPDLPVRTELYNLDAVAYESLVLGLFTIWHGDPEKDVPRGRPKRNSVSLGYSRDGFHWVRPDRRPFYGYSHAEGAWNYGNVQSAGGCCLVVGDELYFYCSGRSGRASSTGLAVLRRDGFASMDAGAAAGTLTTRPVLFRGRRLFVNASVPDGELRAEVLDEAGDVIGPFSAATCVPVRGDGTRQEVRWDGVTDLAAVAGSAVRLRFHLRAGRLYSFWASDTGASHGYVAAGGPGLPGTRDVVGGS